MIKAVAVNGSPRMNKETLDAISRPLISEGELISRYNNSLTKVK